MELVQAMPSSKCIVLRIPTARLVFSREAAVFGLPIQLDPALQTTACGLPMWTPIPLNNHLSLRAIAAVAQTMRPASLASRHQPFWGSPRRLAPIAPPSTSLSWPVALPASASPLWCLLSCRKCMSLIKLLLIIVIFLSSFAAITMLFINCERIHALQWLPL